MLRLCIVRYIIQSYQKRIFSKITPSVLNCMRMTALLVNVRNVSTISYCSLRKVARIKVISAQLRGAVASLPPLSYAYDKNDYTPFYKKHENKIIQN